MKNLEKLKTLQTMLGAQRFILTGSNAAQLHGIVLPKDPDDLDIILVNPTGADHELLGRFQKENPNPKFTGKGALTYSFFFEKVKVDIWVQTSAVHENAILKYEGVSVASLDSIVRAKKSYKRAKDWIQLMQWAKGVFNKDEFEAQLGELGSSDGYSN